jgi:hypothetical protein
MRAFFFASVFLLLTLSSCVTILQSLLTQDNIITDDRVVGQWISNDSKNLLVQKIMDSKFKPTIQELDKHDYTKADSLFFSKLYVISFQENNLDYIWFCGLVRINDQYYINFEPQECLNDLKKESYTLDDQSFFNTSSIAKLEWKGNGLSLHFLNGDRVKKIILNGNARIDHEYDPLFDAFVVTASAKELEQFLEKYGNNESLYDGGRTLNLVRKK